MKFKYVGVILLAFVMILSGCSFEKEPMTSEGTPGDSESSNGYVRSESTIKNDATTGRIITSQSSYQIGTYITLSIYADQQVPDEAFDDFFELINYYENMVSKNIPTSEVSQINQNAGVQPVVVSSELMEMVKIGLGYASDSNGLFDVSIGSLVDLWGIGTENAKVPNEAELKESMATVDYKNIVIDEASKTVYLKDPGMIMDLGALAKGYIADRVKELIIEKGFDAAIVNLGGNVLTVGTKPNADFWRIGVRDPRSDTVTEMGILNLEDNSIVSSGVYERFFLEGEMRYHHIINPKTGYPEQNDMMSVSIVSKNSVDGDALSTTAFLMGLEEGLKYVESLEGIDAVVVMSDLSVYITSGLSEKFVIVNKDYELKN